MNHRKYWRGQSAEQQSQSQTKNAKRLNDAIQVKTKTVSTLPFSEQRKSFNTSK